MRTRVASLLVVVFSLFCLMTVDAAASRNDHSSAGKKQKSDKAKKSGKKKSDLKSYDELIEDRVAVEGLFTFYIDTTDNSMLMAIKPEQYNVTYLCGESRVAAEGAIFDNGSMGQTFPFYFRKIGGDIQWMERNLRLRADSGTPAEMAVKQGISDALIASTDIKSEPHDSTKAILIDAGDLFVRDAGSVSDILNRFKVGGSFDKKNSYFGEVKSFPKNSEIDVHQHFKVGKSISSTSMQNGESFYHTYHFSLIEIPQSDYKPRMADDRLGYFLTLYQDYTEMDRETPYVRYIERWPLKKKNPDARISEPVEPIVYWVDNAWPEEYRDAVAEGIEFWNYAYEKLGFRNAIVAKQMPDTASWDPADARYSVVQYMVQPGGGYAVGPHRANPYTGEIIDADIRVSADFLRYMFNTVQMYIAPVAFDGSMPDGLKEPFVTELDQRPLHEQEFDPRICTYQSETARDAAFGLTYLLATTDDLADKEEIVKEYVHAYLVELIAHEVGHTLGLRHNFRASSIHTLEEIADPDFTREHGVTASCMDYGPPNIAPQGHSQGEFYNSRPGPYDEWVIAYGYSDFGDISPEEEAEKLEEIAARCGEPHLTYATDEDAFGHSVKSTDPLINLHDLGADPLNWAEHGINLSRKLWTEAIHKFEEDGQRYQKLMSVFARGWRSYYAAARIAPKYVGGIHVRRSHIGDPNTGVPFQPVDAAEQRRAIRFLSDHLFAPDAFKLSHELWNKLQQENLQDFSYSAYRVGQVDYPIHQAALAYQNMALVNLYSQYILGRLLNNTQRVPDGAEKYTMYDMFTDLRQSIWSEMDSQSNVNSFRRQLQLAHLTRLLNIYLANYAAYPSDALTLAANDLDIIQAGAERLMNSSNLDGMTRAHYKEVVRQIEAAKSADRQYSND